MRCLMGQIHRQAIIERLPRGGRMLEWGAGGSTVWFADHLPEGASLTSVEHDEQWLSQVAAQLGHRPNVRLLHRPATAALGRNATIEEEEAVPLDSYVHAVDGERFDVILVDGYARGACLRQAQALLAAGGTIFLHDAQRPWYDADKARFIESGSIGSCADYPIPHLWFATLDSGGRPHGVAPIVVSYYTAGTPYQAMADRLRQSCESVGLAHHIVAREPAGSWEENCAAKAAVCLHAWQTLDAPILWVDADAMLREHPAQLIGTDADFAIHKWDGWQFASGTVFFNQTPLAGRLLERWAVRCLGEPTIWDQVHLDLAWEEIVASEPLRTRWLPRAYCQIFDAPRQHGAAAVIEHFQASRECKALVSDGNVRPAPVATEALRQSRRASRPRRRFLPGPDSQDFDLELQIDEALDRQVA